ncbi:hypothetical protein SB659_17515 [Arthrobacter sp. SIMBA_036]
MTEPAQTQITLSLTHIHDENRPALMYLIEQERLGDILVAQILSLLPDPQTWRLTITGDMVRAVNEIEARDDENTYTTDRGAGHVGARTIMHEDGTADIVISDFAFFASSQDMDAPQLIKYARAAAAHIALHEAGHAVLHSRGEGSDDYQDLPQLPHTPHAWRKHLAAHMEDHRIEQLTKRLAPYPLSQVDHLQDALAHFRKELNESGNTWETDIQTACFRALDAANSLIRVMFYLSAELGIENGKAVRPKAQPDGWEEYIDANWSEWGMALHRLKPADEPMEPEEIADVLSNLCTLADAWLRSNGVDYGITDQGPYIYWTKDQY